MSTPTAHKTVTAHHIQASKTSAHKVSADKTRLWVVCCEETEATQQLSNAIEKWQLPGVRSLFTESLLTHRTPEQGPLSETIAASDYAIFVTPYHQPSTQVQVSPLDVTHLETEESDSPAALLSAIHNRHGQSPQSWWLQVPTTQLRAHQAQPIPAQESAAQALDQIGIFIRNYHLALPPIADNAKPTALNDSTKNVAQKTTQKETSPQTKPQTKEVTFIPYRRI